MSEQAKPLTKEERADIATVYIRPEFYLADVHIHRYEATVQQLEVGIQQVEALVLENDSLRTKLAEREAALQSMEQHLRQTLWLRHGCLGMLYGDDGEMQCSGCLIGELYT